MVVRAVPDDAKIVDIFTGEELGVVELASRVKQETVIRGEDNLPEQFAQKGGPVMRSNQTIPQVTTG